MSKFTEQLKTLRVFNSHGFAGHGGVWIEFYAAEYGRASRSAHYTVHRSGHQTEPTAPWYDYGNKVFNCWGREDKPVKFAEAKAWAGKIYGIKEWTRTPFGGWMDAEFVKRRIAHLKAQLKAVGAAS